jgi:ketosteroid isomerase-like protein
VTLSGAWGPCKSGWEEVSPVFRWLASRFCGVTDYRLDLVAAGLSGDLAYTVGSERSALSIDGGPVQENVLRVTRVFRRENGEWKIVHRHGDFPLRIRARGPPPSGPIRPLLHFRAGG